ncbi:acetyltransferase (GNAT) family domain-containing protein [Ditylenchus destructor]|nr:acetyltransferase (GNAT) family domain-containing protein [Ditylenchus destructor]
MENFDIRINPSADDERAWNEICQDALKHNGWRIEGKIDYECWLEGIPSIEFAFFYDKENGQRVGCLSAALDESEELAHIGFFFFLPEYRGKGIGTKLFEWTMAKDKFKEAKNWAIMSDYKRVKYYQSRHGFDKLGWNYSPVAVSTKVINMHVIKGLIEKQILEKVELVSPKSLENWQKVFEYDQKFFGGMNRDKFVKAFLTHPGAHAKIALEKDSGNVVGVGCIRETTTGDLIVGPLYADTPAIAETVILDLLSSLPWDLNDYDLLITIPISDSCMPEVMSRIFGKENAKVKREFAQALFTKVVIEVPRKDVYSIWTSGLFVV